MNTLYAGTGKVSGVYFTAEVDHVQLGLPQTAGDVPQIWLVYPQRLARTVARIAGLMDTQGIQPEAYITLRPPHVAVFFRLPADLRTLEGGNLDDIRANLVSDLLNDKFEIITSGENDFGEGEVLEFLRLLKASGRVLDVFVAQSDEEGYRVLWTTRLTSFESRLPQFN